MAVTGEDMARMFAQIVNGVSKNDSPLVTNRETAAAWDELVAYFEANPDQNWDVPSEWGQGE